MAGTFRYTRNDDYDGARSDAFRISSTPQADLPIAVGTEAALGQMVIWGDGDSFVYSQRPGSGTFLLTQEGRNATPDLGGVLFDWSDGNSSATFHGTGFGDRLVGGARGDRLFGGAGGDDLLGNAGNDVLVGGKGDDLLSGGAGQDIVDYSQEGGGRGVVVSLIEGRAIDTYGHDDRIEAVQNVRGTDDADRLSGDDVANQLIGSRGDDLLFGFGGSDVLDGGAGRDWMRGDDGRDRFVFDALRDTGLRGERDVIWDFETDRDFIDLRGIDAKEGGGERNQRFEWVDEQNLDASFGRIEGQLRFADGILEGDTDGDGRADFEIRVVGSLSSGDVLL